MNFPTSLSRRIGSRKLIGNYKFKLKKTSWSERQAIWKFQVLISYIGETSQAVRPPHPEMAQHYKILETSFHINGGRTIFILT